MTKLEETQAVHSELVAIKQLLIVALMRDGMQQSQIAAAMGVSDATLSRTFPKGLLKSLKNGRDAAD
jgi:hypothetical protein